MKIGNVPTSKNFKKTLSIPKTTFDTQTRILHTQENINQYQKFSGTEKRPVQYTRPGYEVCIYSRFENDNKQDLYTNPQNFAGYNTTGEVPSAGNGKSTYKEANVCRPTFRFFSDVMTEGSPTFINKNQVPVVTSINAHQITDANEGSACVIHLIQPDGVEFFNPTIGHAPPNYPDIDYHALSPSDGPLRVGVMDTVLIRMSNDRPGLNGQMERITETVFRGVIASIRRNKNAESGTFVSLQLFDFSEFMRQITGLGMGVFSTTNFHLTGRGFIKKLVEYSNALYSGNTSILNVTQDTAGKIGQDIQSTFLLAAQTAANTANSVVQTVQNKLHTGTSFSTDIGQLTPAKDSQRANPTHKMSNPPVFWLQYSPLDKISIENKVTDDNFGGSSPKSLADARAGALTQTQSNFSDINSQLGNPAGAISNATGTTIDTTSEVFKNAIAAAKNLTGAEFNKLKDPETYKQAQKIFADSFNVLQDDIKNPVNILPQIGDALHGGFANTKEIYDQYTDAIKTNLNAFEPGIERKLLTPEDRLTIKTYDIFAGSVPANVQKSVESLFQAFNVPVPQSGSQLSEIAWAISDLYITKGLVNFAHEYIWQSIFSVARRTMREAYFDFSPKLAPKDLNNSKGALVPFDTASVPEIHESYLNQEPLCDVHPNVGILKYRLSPCFIPYSKALSDNNLNGVSETSLFRFYAINDDDILETDSAETEDQVFTAVFGFGSDVGKASVVDQVNSLLSGQSRGLIATAETLDTRLESRLGYRFKTDHDNTIRIPIIMYITSYSILHKSQVNMFQQTITVPGNPRIQPGSIVKVVSQNADYYCTQVLHSWDINSGYTTQLQLQFGHTTGLFPKMLYTNGVYEEANDTEQNGCTLQNMQLMAEGLNNLKPIGGVDQGCLILALQQYMSQVSSVDNSPTLEANTSVLFPTGGGKMTGAELETLFASVCTGANAKYKKYAQIMSWIALGETNGETRYISLANPDGPDPDRHPELNFQYSYGLWQCSPGDFSKPNPISYIQSADGNARYALSKLIEQGFEVAWGLPGLNTSDPAAAFAQINSRYKPVGRVQSDLGGTPKFDATVSTAINAQPANWPYKVYGYIGMQYTSYNKGPYSSSSGAPNRNAYIKDLQSEDKGLSYAKSYIAHLSTKYAKNNTLFSPYNDISDLAEINKGGALAKVIAAWFCDDGDAPKDKFKTGFLNQVVTQVESLYQTCSACVSSDPGSFDAASNKELTASLDDRQMLLSSNKLGIRRPSDTFDLLNKYSGSTGTTGNLIKLLGWLTQTKGWNIAITEVHLHHEQIAGSDGPNGHSGGKAVDCFPNIYSVSNSEQHPYGPYVPDDQLDRFLTDCVEAHSVGLVKQIGLGGSIQTYPKYLAIISSLGINGFADGRNNTSIDNDHIHLGV